MKRALIALLPLFVVAACSSGTQQSSSGPGNSDVATGGEQFSTADEETARLGTDAEPGLFPRTVTHASGETVIESKPERVVVLDTGELDDVLSLGITPVGMVVPEGDGQPSYLQDKLDDIAEVGAIGTPDVEAVAALKPDLILGSKLRVDKLYDQLSAIAPTVFSIRPGFPWKENFLLVGDALGEEDRAVQVLNDYQAKADEVRASLDGAPTISMVRFLPGKIRLYGNLSFIGVILKDVGLPRPAIQDIDELAVETSPENIVDADGDRIFYSSYGSPSATDQSTVVGSPLWATIPAVAAGNAQEVSDELWFLALGPTGAMLVLDDLQVRLAP